MSAGDKQNPPERSLSPRDREALSAELKAIRKRLDEQVAILRLLCRAKGIDPDER